MTASRCDWLISSEYEAKVVAYAANKDLAVIRVTGAPASKLTPLPLGVSQRLLVGQTVLAVGNPFGLDHSLTVGVVSALGRELSSPGGRRIYDMIQTDAAINPGNSGGPLLDSSGRLMGVNSAIYSPSGASAGIGFAIPVDVVKRLVPQLIARRRPVVPGIGIVALPESMVRRSQLEGVVVQEVVPGSPAAKAGMEGLRRASRGGARTSEAPSCRNSSFGSRFRKPPAAVVIVGKMLISGARRLDRAPCWRV